MKAKGHTVSAVIQRLNEEADTARRYAEHGRMSQDQLQRTLELTTDYFERATLELRSLCEKYTPGVDIFQHPILPCTEVSILFPDFTMHEVMPKIRLFNCPTHQKYAETQKGMCQQMRHQKPLTRIISAILTLAMLCGLVPTMALAAHEHEALDIIEYKAMTLVNMQGGEWISRYQDHRCCWYRELHLQRLKPGYQHDRPRGQHHPL